MTVIAYAHGLQAVDVPKPHHRSEKEGFVAVKAAQAFNIPNHGSEQYVGYDMGICRLPPKGVKDPESVGPCSQTFTVCDCQPKALEIAYGDPELPEGIFDPDTAQRFYLSPGDLFRVPPGNRYRIQNRSKTKDALITWTIIRTTNVADYSSSGSNAAQKKLIEDLQKETDELKARLQSMEQVQQEAEISYSNLHAQFTAMEKENSDLKRSLHQSRQKLNTAHAERDDARKSLQSVRVQAHNEKDARLKEVQEKLVNVKREWVEKAKENGRLKKKTRAAETALDELRELPSNTGEESNTLVKIESAVKKEIEQVQKDKGNPNAG